MINNIFLLLLCYYNELLGITIKKQSVFIAQLFANGSKGPDTLSTAPQQPTPGELLSLGINFPGLQQPSRSH